MSNRIIGLIVAAVLATTLSACYGDANTNNVNNANANRAPSPTPTAVATSTPRTTAPTREEYERDKERSDREAREEARRSGRTIGTGASDAWLWVKTRFDLAAVDDLRDSTINVDVDNAVVTLTGTVASAAQRTRAEQSAKSVEGVRSVRNQLKVAADNTNARPANTNR